jgi:hypothetical protein
MPRKKQGPEESPRRLPGELVEQLANELKNNRESGQPLIYEQEFPSGKSRVTVLWDKWDRLPLENRTAVILRACELAEGADARARIGLASGLTFPEAHAAGMLPYQVFPAVRKTDPVTPDACRQAMLEEGASTLFEPNTAQLRFATEEEAASCVARLSRRLPESEPVWVIIRDVPLPDADGFSDAEEAVP